MIYHPRGTELNRGLFEENSLEAAKYEDGTYEIRSGGQNETVIVGSVAYTGWKMIGVVPESVQAANYKNFRYYVFATVLVLMVMLLEGNQLVSRKISKPIRELDASVKAHEAGGKPDIYIGGSSEIRHLGHSVQKSYEQIEKLMDEIIRQQNERRKSELDALQSQINPHFLYNTLESITWMVEAQENEAAVRMISELAKLLRVSLSRGKTIIPIKDELQHSRSYMNIQLARYKERFKTEFRIEEEIENCCIVKLVIQPILENAIYYGVGNMDEDDGGMIIVSGKKKDEDILITIEDNGMGMREEVLENILTDNSKVPKHGSGVEEMLAGRICYGGLDLSSTTDITAFVLVFPPTEDEEHYYILPYFWLPEETLPLRVRRDHVPYDVWERQGYLKTTEGNVVHYGFIENFIDELGQKFHIKEIAFDRWGAVQMSQNLEGLGFTMVQFGQGYKDMSPPTKELMKLTLEQTLAHSGHPVLRWMMDNIFIRRDPAGNIKPDKEKSTEKIDGAVAMIMALDRAIRCGCTGDGTSVYDERDMLIL